MGDFVLDIDGVSLEGQWTEGNAETRAAIEATLPIEGAANRWGDELYLGIEVSASPTDTTTIVEPGDVAYWPAGPALCLFWGPTPASTDERPRAASPVGVIGRVTGLDALSGLDGGATLSMRLLDP